MPLQCLGAVIDLAAPLIKRGLDRRLARGQEIADRLPERFGFPSAPRPDGPLLWLHGASLGETNSLRPLIDWFLDQSPAHHVLLTSGSKSSSQHQHRTLPSRAVHQLLPAENSRWIDRFLAHWRPDALVLAEQEFWPQLLMRVKRHAIPSLVVNARLSARSFGRWRKLSAVGLGISALVDTVHAQDERQAQRFAALGFKHCVATGNLKFAVAGDEASKVRVSERGVDNGSDWTVLFAMSHPEEEEAAAVHWANALAQLPELRLVHCPRHVERVGADDARPKWSSGARPTARQREVVVDQYGVMADVYAHADVVVLGGTFTKRVGGHSPIEALNARRPVVVGPHLAAQQSIMDVLVPTGAVGVARSIEHAIDLAIERQGYPEQTAQELAVFRVEKSKGTAALVAAKSWISMVVRTM